MSRYISVITPENVEVTHEIAGIGSRFIGALVDHALQLLAVIGGAVVFTLAFTGLGGLSRVFAGAVPGWLALVLALWTFLVLAGYHVTFELLWSGQTPGKRVAGARVVRDGGRPIDPSASVIRNLVRIVDLLPLSYGVGLATIFFDREYRRLGDIAAGTLVVRERRADGLGAFGKPPTALVTGYMEQLGDVSCITAEELRALRRFSARRNELAIAIQAHIAMRLAAPLLERLGADLQVEIQWHYADILEAIERRCLAETAPMRRSGSGTGVS